MEELTWETRKSIVSTWPLMGSYVPFITITSVYLFLVFVFLPKFMSNRKPYNLKFIIRWYNIGQICMCVYAVWKLHLFGFSFKNTWKCIPTDGEFTRQLMQLNESYWFFIIMRLVEYFETIFFVLRKKSHQVSALHVYHHISTAFLLITFLKYSGGIMEVYLGAVNSVVHIIMYIYYLLSSFEMTKGLTNKVKPFLTLIQITQLVIILGHSIVGALPSCGTVHWVYYLQIINLSLLLTLFVRFYRQSFSKKKEN
ncbi:unnamed protein product [Chironomus riparius]|uniref:Elongation of very long chain fatty acids protein n=1 Tax=Chironomus riparius TaxID=315576 RepID=A0A9N9S0J6_9DIPT|nr:unnamed protein product [Chironomus riparius]